MQAYACSYIKKTLTQVFSCEFCEILKNTFSWRTPLVASVRRTLLNFPTYVTLSYKKLICRTLLLQKEMTRRKPKLPIATSNDYILRDTLLWSIFDFESSILFYVGMLTNWSLHFNFNSNSIINTFSTN